MFTGKNYPILIICIVLFIVSIGSTYSIYVLRQQDTMKTTEIRKDCFSMIEQYALDGLDKYLEETFKAEGCALLVDNGEALVEEYVQTQMEQWDIIKSDVENLTLSNVTVYRGSYHQTTTGSGSGKAIIQSLEELPKYTATLEGDIKTLLKGSNGGEGSYHFKIDIKVVAEHVGRASGYIQ